MAATRSIRLLVALPLAAAVLGSVSALGAGTAATAASYWIVLSSDRDGQLRGYSVRPDGSRLSPLLPQVRAVTPVNISGDGGTIFYSWEGLSSYVSRGNGKGLRRLRIPDSIDHRLSRDGGLVAFEKDGVWIVGTDGRGLRRLTSQSADDLQGWSPDGNALLALRGRELVVLPVRGTPRVLVRAGDLEGAAWSPDGRWIAYRTDRGLYLLKSDGTHRHRIAGGTFAYAWSPDGGKVAFTVGEIDIALVGVDGRAARRLHLRGPKRTILQHLTWSPDGRVLAFDADRGSFHTDVWVVGANGRGLRRLTSIGHTSVIGWTPLAPVQPPARSLLPSERVIDANTVATRTPVRSLSADGPRVAFAPGSTGADCEHVAVWTPAVKKINRFRAAASCSDRLAGLRGHILELAGSRAAWIENGTGSDCVPFALVTATLTERSPRRLARGSTPCGGLLDYYLHGHGDLLVFNDGPRTEDSGYALVRSQAKLLRIGADGKPTVIRSGEHACCADSVSGGLIAINEGNVVAVLDKQGALVRVFPFDGAPVSAARLDGERLVVSRSSTLEMYDVQSGARQLQRTLPRDYELTDVDGGIAVLQGKKSMLLRLEDGRSYTLPNHAQTQLADLEPPGLYYSYATASGEGRVVLMPRAEIVRHLGGS